MEWIDIKDKLPEKDTYVLVIDKADDMYVAYLSLGKTHSYWAINCRCHEGSEPYSVTHWMPLPNQPERSKREDCTCSTKRKYLGIKKQCRCGALNTVETS